MVQPVQDLFATPKVQVDARQKRPLVAKRVHVQSSRGHFLLGCCYVVTRGNGTADYCFSVRNIPADIVNRQQHVAGQVHSMRAIKRD